MMNQPFTLLCNSPPPKKHLKKMSMVELVRALWPPTLCKVA